MRYESREFAVLFWVCEVVLRSSSGCAGVAAWDGWEKTAHETAPDPPTAHRSLHAMDACRRRYARAAGRGLPAAQFELGACFAEGRGREQDLAQAARWSAGWEVEPSWSRALLERHELCEALCKSAPVRSPLFDPPSARFYSVELAFPVLQFRKAWLFRCRHMDGRCNTESAAFPIRAACRRAAAGGARPRSRGTWRP